MPLRKLVSLKRAALQSRIDAMAAREQALNREIDTLNAQGSGLSMGALEGGAFQRADMAGRIARQSTTRLTAERDRLSDARRTLLRERLSLDIADRKLEAAGRAQARLDESRADLRD